MQVPTISVADVPDPLPDGLCVIDVREDVEWAYGHIENAVHIPLATLPQRLADLPDAQLLVVCKIGARSERAAAYLARAGHDAVNLDGGMLDWAGANRPMVSEIGAPPRVI